MLELLRRSHRYFVGGIILLIGGVFVAYLGLGGPSGMTGGPDAVVQLDQRRYTVSDLQRVRDEQERNLRENLGEAFDPQAAGQYLDQLSADLLIQRAVLASEAERLGLRASEPEIKALVQRAFSGPDGGYDGKAVREFAVRRFGSESRFVQEVRDDILFSKLLAVIDAGAAVSDAEARDAVRTRLEEVKLAYVALDREQPPPGVEADEEAVETVLREQPERVRSFYDEHADRYHLGERVRVRHLLIRVEKDAPEEEVEGARGRAEAALGRIRAGEDFAAVAGEVSEDPGSKEQGGDLGEIERGRMVPAFEEVAFALEPGATSDVFRTDFGFHVVHSDSREPAVDRSFDEVAREIAQELANQDRARERATELGDRLLAAVRSGTTLEAAAAEEGVDLKSTDWLRRRRDGYVPGLGAAAPVLTAAFAADPEHPSVPRLFEVGPQLVLIEVIEERGPGEEDLARELPAERERLLTERRNELRNDWMREARARLQQEQRLHVDLSGVLRDAS